MFKVWFPCQFAQTISPIATAHNIVTSNVAEIFFPVVWREVAKACFEVKMILIAFHLLFTPYGYMKNISYLRRNKYNQRKLNYLGYEWHETPRLGIRYMKGLKLFTFLNILLKNYSKDKQTGSSFRKILSF